MNFDEAAEFLRPLLVRGKDDDIESRHLELGRKGDAAGKRGSCNLCNMTPNAVRYCF